MLPPRPLDGVRYPAEINYGNQVDLFGASVPRTKTIKCRGVPVCSDKGY